MKNFGICYKDIISNIFFFIFLICVIINIGDNMKNRIKGFTLIELLAVIVILGLLMAIAIPSVTKYITQSRKKTITTTIGNYIGALTNQVNDMEYVFTKSNTIYGVPIECITLERGGTDPFGEWIQMSDSYWAYVLVQYDDASSSYTYGFTFKDSAGYGLYPTTSEKLNERGSQILTNLTLSRPKNGNITNITAKENWLGFNVDDNTQFQLLVANLEGELGNGTTTCTLAQKGNNYSDMIYYGDVNEDGYINEEDKDLLQSFVLGYSIPSSSQERRGDVNGSGNLTAADVAHLNAYILGKIDRFAVQG